LERKNVPLVEKRKSRRGQRDRDFGLFPKKKRKKKENFLMK